MLYSGLTFFGFGFVVVFGFGSSGSMFDSFSMESLIYRRMAYVGECNQRSLLWDMVVAAFFKTSFLTFAFFTVLYFSMKGKRMST